MLIDGRLNHNGLLRQEGLLQDALLFLLPTLRLNEDIVSYLDAQHGMHEVFATF